MTQSKKHTNRDEEIDSLIDVVVVHGRVVHDGRIGAIPAEAKASRRSVAVGKDAREQVGIRSQVVGAASPYVLHRLCFLSVFWGILTQLQVHAISFFIGISVIVICCSYR